MVVGEEVGSHLLQQLGRELFELAVGVFDAFDAIVVEVGFSHVEGIVFEVVARHTDLSSNLPQGCLEARLGERLLHQSVQFFPHQPDAAFHVLRVAAEIDGKRAGVGVVGQRTLDGIDQPLVFAQGDVEQGVHAWSANQIVQKIECDAALVVRAVAAATDHDVCLVGVELADDSEGLDRLDGLDGTAEGRDRGVCLRQDLFQLSLNDRLQFLKIVASEHKQHHPFGLIEATGEAKGVVGAERAHTFGRSENIVAERMALEEQVFEVVEDEVRGRVLVAVNFFDDHFGLFLDLVLRIGAVKSHVEDEVDGPFEVFAHEGGVDERLLLRRVSVEVAPDSLHAVEDMPSPTALRSLEQHVFAEVRHAVFLGQFVACACIDGQSAVGNVGRTGHVDEAQA